MNKQYKAVRSSYISVTQTH